MGSQYSEISFRTASVGKFNLAVVHASLVLAIGFKSVKELPVLALLMNKSAIKHCCLTTAMR
jgi:hypothetical protein